jgi:DNA polymerase-3 subunit gamma/tau
MEDEATELYRRYRPTKLKEMVGQREAVRMVGRLLQNGELPHVILFTGPSGVGKTTLARIIRAKLGCSDTDFYEVNAAKDRGIDIVRSISARKSLAPMGGPCRIWLIDEAAEMTPQAQGSFLIDLEDTPQHVYFFLATTDPQKLRQTIITRSTEIRLSSISVAALTELVERISQAEGVQLGDKVIEKICDIADGSARKAIVLLHQVRGAKTEEDQLKELRKSDTKYDAIELCRLLLKEASWRDVCDMIKGIQSEPEGVRRLVLVYASKASLGGNKRALTVLESFRDNFYDTGLAGLILACSEVMEV